MMLGCARNGLGGIDLTPYGWRNTSILYTASTYYNTVYPGMTRWYVTPLSSGGVFFQDFPTGTTPPAPPGVNGVWASMGQALASAMTAPPSASVVSQPQPVIVSAPVQVAAVSTPPGVTATPPFQNWAPAGGSQSSGVVAITPQMVAPSGQMNAYSPQVAPANPTTADVAPTVVATDHATDNATPIDGASLSSGMSSSSWLLFALGLGAVVLFTKRKG
jgi:hypothetical protein